VARAGARDGEPIFEGTAAQTRVDVPPGSYAVTAKAGLVTATQTFVVPPSGPVRAAVALEAGALKLVTHAQKAGPPIDRVTYTIRAAAGTDLKTAASGEIRWLGRDPSEPLLLPPGSYLIRAERGLAHAERLVTVPAASTGLADFTLSAGLLTLKAAADERGRPFATALFVISEDDPESPTGRREVARSAAPAPDFVLPAGTYHVLVRIGPAEVREQVALGAGESLTRTVLVGMGRLEITSARTAQQAAPSGRDAISFQVIALDGGAREVGRFSTTPQTVELPAGSYRIDAQIGGQNVRTTEKVSLTAGRTTRVSFDLKVAHATFRLAERIATTTAADVFWEIRDAAGASVWRTGQIEPRVVLAPGSYTVAATLRDRTLTGAFELRPGESRTIEVGGTP
jgi:Ca-activated chloride channel family protein